MKKKNGPNFVNWMEISRGIGCHFSGQSQAFSPDKQNETFPLWWPSYNNFLTVPLCPLQHFQISSEKFLFPGRTFGFCCWAAIRFFCRPSRLFGRPPFLSYSGTFQIVRVLFIWNLSWWPCIEMFQSDRISLLKWTRVKDSQRCCVQITEIFKDSPSRSLGISKNPKESLRISGPSSRFLEIHSSKSRILKFSWSKILDSHSFSALSSKNLKESLRIPKNLNPEFKILRDSQFPVKDSQRFLITSRRFS